jgi:hypothetical protein
MASSSHGQAMISFVDSHAYDAIASRVFYPSSSMDPFTRAHQSGNSPPPSMRNEIMFRRQNMMQ